MEDLISIIIPMYNSQKYIGECIESLLNQTYKNIEIIIVDDGSTDNSYNIVNEYKKKSSKIILLKKQNGGVSSARNYGIENSTGKFITFVDSDDFVDFNYCEELYNKMTDDLSMVVLGMKRKYANGQYTNEYSMFKEGIYNFMTLTNDVIDNGSFSGFLFRSACSVLFRSEYIKLFNLRFNSNIKYNEDGLFTTLYFFTSKQNVYVDFNNYVYCYRCNESSAAMTVNLLSEKFQDDMNLISEILNNILSIDHKIIENQINRRKVTLFIDELLSLSHNKQLNKKLIIERYKYYKIDENLKTIVLNRLTFKKKIVYLLLKLKLYFILNILL